MFGRSRRRGRPSKPWMDPLTRTPPQSPEICGRNGASRRNGRTRRAGVADAPPGRGAAGAASGDSRSAGRRRCADRPRRFAGRPFAVGHSWPAAAGLRAVGGKLARGWSGGVAGRRETRPASYPTNVRSWSASPPLGSDRCGAPASRPGAGCGIGPRSVVLSVGRLPRASGAESAASGTTLGFGRWASSGQAGEGPRPADGAAVTPVRPAEPQWRGAASERAAGTPPVALESQKKFGPDPRGRPAEALGRPETSLKSHENRRERKFCEIVVDIRPAAGHISVITGRRRLGAMAHPRSSSRRVRVQDPIGSGRDGSALWSQRVGDDSVSGLFDK